VVNLYKSEKPFRLSHTLWEKRYFDPYSKEDVKEYKLFLERNSWHKGCPFHLEWPYLTITEMIKSKLINAHLESMIKNGK